jgi:anti-sigma factor RsiW
MNETKLSPDDPRLTAYALGELEDDERAAVESALQTDAAARAAVEAIRATARQIEAALASEPEIISPPLKARHVAPYATARKLVQFPYWLVGGLAAACFAVVLVLHESQVMRMEQQRKAAIAARIEAMEKADWADREREFKKSAVATAEAKPSPYTEVTFPVAAIPSGRVEIQSMQQAIAAHKTAVVDESIAPNQPADVETVKLQAFDAAAAPARGSAASETMAGTRETTDIAGVNNRAAYDFPSRAAPDGFNPEADHAGGGFSSVAQNPLSTFGLDVGTVSYTNVRRFLQAGQRPPADAVHIEELVNHFPYAYAAPRDNVPLAATLEVAAAPWASAHRLVRIGLKACEVTAGGTPVTVAKDVKAQVEFNPAKVQSYRLIGYDDRTLKKKDFNKDAITAGDLGAGHTVTALYEIVPVGVEPPAIPGVDALKYQTTRGQKPDAGGQSAELLTVTVRYTRPEGGASQRLEFPLADRGAAFAEASMDFKFAAAVAGFGMILRDSPDKGRATLAEVEQWAGQGLGTDAGGYRAEFIGLVHQAEKLKE